VKGDPEAMLPRLIREVGRVDPDVPVTETMTRLTQAALGASNLRLTRDVVGYAALLAMVLTAIGLYGVLAFSVHRRTKELGIRMALGASAAHVRRMVLQQGDDGDCRGDPCGPGSGRRRHPIHRAHAVRPARRRPDVLWRRWHTGRVDRTPGMLASRTASSACRAYGGTAE
jgi:hypothetical protein